MAASPATLAPFPELIETSFEEAAFLWTRWESELTSLTRSLGEIWSWTEDRLLGSLDGVAVAGEGIVDIVAPELVSDDLSRVTVASYALASSPVPRAATVLAQSLEQAKGPRLAATIRALELGGNHAALRAAVSVLSAGGPEYNAALCRLKSFRRAVPGEEMVAAFDSNIPAWQAAALRASRHLDAGSVDSWVMAGLKSSDAQARYIAVESGIRHGLARALQAALDSAAQLDDASGPYLSLIAIAGQEASHEIVFNALRDPKLQHAAIWTLGHLGTRRAVEACLFGMQHEKLARASAEAYCCITGADLARDHLAAAESLEETPEFEADDLDANLVPSADQSWPRPDVAAVKQHWQQLQTRFQGDTRYVRGRPASLQTLMEAVESGPMLRRPDWVLELSARSHARYDVETGAFSARQRSMMANARAALGTG